MQMNAFLCSPFDSEHPLLQNSAIMIRNDFNEDSIYGTFMYEGPSPLPDGISLSLVTNISGEGPTHLKAIVEGQNMAYWDTHI